MILGKKSHIFAISILCIWDAFLTPVYGEMRELNDNFTSALVYKIATFVRWPSNPKQPVDQFHICLFNGEADSNAFIQLEGKELFSKLIKVSNFKRTDSIKLDCNILYITPSKFAFIKRVLKRIEGHPILTISNDHTFSKYGGMISIGIQAGKISFLIRKHAVDEAGLAISAPLLQLSTIVPEQEG